MIIEHVAIWAGDIELLKEFYMRYFGGKPGERYTNPKKNFDSYFISFKTGARLELMQMPGVISRDSAFQYIGYSHVAFKLDSKEKVIELTETLRKDGYRIVSEPRVTGDGYFESCVLDPEGNRVEITA